MSDITESCCAVLDVGRDKLSEGDFLKLAAFLDSLHKSKSATNVLTVKRISHNFKLEYQTIKSKKSVVIKITDLIKIYKSNNSDKSWTEFHVVGSINDVPFNMLRNQFIDKIVRQIAFCGMRNIKRTMDDLEDEFDHYPQFKGHTRDRASDAEDEDDDFDVDLLSEDYFVCELLCLDADLFDSM